jgi:hypothetical protein
VGLVRVDHLSGEDQFLGLVLPDESTASPTWRNPKLIFDRSLAICVSQAIARFAPAPKAVPSIFATTGSGNS